VLALLMGLVADGRSRGQAWRTLLWRHCCQSLVRTVTFHPPRGRHTRSKGRSGESPV